MTIDYSKGRTEDVGDDEPAVPVVVKTGSEYRPARSEHVRVVVEKHRTFTWIVRGVWMGVGFAGAVKVLQIVMEAYGL